MRRADSDVPAGEACALPSLFDAEACAATRDRPWDPARQVPCTSIREGNAFQGVCERGICWET